MGAQCLVGARVAVREALAGAARGAGEALLGAAQLRREGGSLRHGQGGRRRGRRRAQVGREIRDGHVDLVADAAHHGNPAGPQRAGEALRVVGLEILERPSAAHEQDHVHLRDALERLEGRGDLLLGSGSLHPRGREEQRKPGEAPAGNLDDVVDGRALRRRHHTETARNPGQRPLVRRVEQSLGREARAQLLEGDLERAAAAGLEVAHEELEVAARLVDRRLAEDEHLEPFLGLEHEAARRAAEERGAELRSGVLQGEVVVPRRRAVQIAQLAGDPDAADALLEEPAQARQQLAHAEHPGPAAGIGAGPRIAGLAQRVWLGSTAAWASCAAWAGAGGASRRRSK